MFFALGLIGFLFACLAPGYIAVTAFGLKSRLPPFAGPFAISLIVNNILVEALAAGGLYTHAIFLPLTILAVSIAAMALVFDERLCLTQLAAQIGSARQALCGLGGRTTAGRVIVAVCALALGGTVLALIFWGAPKYIGGTLLGYDPAVSWNSWALQWASNRMAGPIAHYPQLIPTLWSIPYVAAGNSDVQFFSSSFKILFWLGSFETLVFIALRRGQAVLILSVGFLGFLFRYWGGPTSLEDYVDVPVAFFALISVGVLLANEKKTDDATTITLALILAGGAAMTKQVGLYMLAATPLLVVALAYEQRKTWASVRQGAFLALPGLLLACLAAAPIYIYAIATVRNGTNTSELSYLLTNQYDGLDYLARAGRAFGQLFDRTLLRVGSTAVILAAIASLKDRTVRWVFLIISLPFLLIWATNFSYDTRNLTLAMPFWALCAAAGVARFAAPAGPIPAQTIKPVTWRWPASMPPFNRHGVAVFLLVSIAALAWAGSEKMPYPAMRARQQTLERQRLGDQPECTEKMIALLGTFPASHRILSEWRWACTFHFNDPKYCARIFSGDFFAAGSRTFSRFSGENLLVILNRSSLTPTRLSSLHAAGLSAAGHAQCYDQEFFVRHLRN